ncbi:MAG: DinB family protein [Actinomycetes bacterium]
MSGERVEPALELPEREMLRAWLDYHRATLAWKCAGLSDDQLRESAVPPSRLSLLGIVRHMGEVERWWFRVVFGRQEDVERYPDSAEWRDLDSADVSADFVVWQQECDQARAIEASAPSLDEVGLERYRGQDVEVSLRWVMTHMIEEYARHNGHADLLRERIDGATGD